MTSPVRTTQFPATHLPDAPMVLDASWRFDRSDRAYIDGQILGLQQVVAGGTFSGDAISFKGTALDSSMTGPADGSFIEKVAGKWAAVTASVVAAAVSGFLALGGDVTGPLASTVVGKINGTSVPASPSATFLLQATSTTTATWANPSSIVAGGISPGSSGQIYVTNQVPTAAWTSLISYETTHGRLTSGGSGSDYKAVIGPLVGFETQDAGIWFLPAATAPTSANVALWCDASNTYMNNGSGTATLAFIVAGSTYLGAFNGAQSRFYAGGSTAAAPLIVDWATSLQTQILTGTAQTSFLLAAVGSASKIIFQADTGGITWRDNSQVQRGSIDLTHGIAKFGGAGSDWYGAIGPDDSSPTVESCVWLLPPGTARTGSNSSLLNNGSATYINTQGTFISMSTSSFGVNLAWFSQNGIVTLWGLNQFEWVHNVGAPTLLQDARLSDLPTNNFTIRAQYPFATATGANRVPGSIVLDIGLPTNSGTTEAFFTFTRNAIEGARIVRTASAQWSLYLGQQVAFSTTNMALISDASTFTYLNTQTSGAIGMITADATFLLYIPTTQDHLYFLGTTTAASWYVDSTTTTTPIVSSGTSATSLTVQTNKSAATLVMKAGAASTVLTLASALATFATAVALQGTNVAAAGDVRAQNNSTILAARNAANSADLALVATDGSNNVTFGEATNAADINIVAGTGTWRAKLGASAFLQVATVGSVRRSLFNTYVVNTLTSKGTAYTINSAGGGDYDIWMTGTCTITLPTPEAGMFFRIIVAYDPTATGGTIARHAAENINNAASNITLTGTDKFSILLVASNGTDWIIKGGLAV